MEKLGEKISHLRDAMGWTQEDLSVKSTVARRTIQNIEKPTKPDYSPGLDVVILIADALGVSVSYLIDGKATRAELILEIHSHLNKLDEKDLETISMTTKNLAELAESNTTSRSIES